MKKYLFIISSLFVINTQAQIVFNTTQPIDTLIQDFVGAGITLSNVTFVGGPISIGSFNGPSSLGLLQGIAFSSGNIDTFVSTPASTFLSTSLSLPGDSDLTTLIGGISTYDAATLEFDFVATNATLLFDYVFASEEYNDYVNTSFNDVFAFFISGPGIIGKQNIALIPGTNTPVSINNVNNGGPYSGLSNGPCNNCQYFIDNFNDQTVAYDGFTTPLTATYTLVPGLTYHLKLSVADAGDGVFDTGVFLQKYSLRTVNPAGVTENILSQTNMFVYDNMLHINLTSNLMPHYTLYAVDGKKVAEQTLSDINSTFDLSNLTPGIYSVVLDADGETYTGKIAIK